MKRELLLARNITGNSKKVPSVPWDRKDRNYLRELWANGRQQRGLGHSSYFLSQLPTKTRVFLCSFQQKNGLKTRTRSRFHVQIHGQPGGVSPSLPKKLVRATSGAAIIMGDDSVSLEAGLKTLQELSAHCIELELPIYNNQVLVLFLVYPL